MQIADLPALNATLNGCSFVLLLLAGHAIRSGNEGRHRALMLSATGVSGLFLISYLTYHYYHGSTKFTGEGLIRTVYFTILISHTILAAVLVPLVVATLTLALRGLRDRHRRVARITWPIWLYVSATGVIIYLMLYQL
jgi:putative membrane protein